jgi:hypothetical protein
MSDSDAMETGSDSDSDSHSFVDDTKSLDAATDAAETNVGIINNARRNANGGFANRRSQPSPSSPHIPSRFEYLRKFEDLIMQGDNQNPFVKRFELATFVSGGLAPWRGRQITFPQRVMIANEAIYRFEDRLDNPLRLFHRWEHTNF